MNPVAIYRAALESALEALDLLSQVGPGHWPTTERIIEGSRTKARGALDAAAKAEADEETTHSRMSASAKARRKREAAAKAPGLGDDEKAVNVVAHDFATGTGCRLCSNRTDGRPCAPCRAYAMIALRAIDTYQRGGARVCPKPVDPAPPGEER